MSSPTFETFYVYVDAVNGDILKTRSSHIDVTADVYGYGNRNIDTKWRGGFIQKYGARANVMGKLDRKLSMVETALDIIDTIPRLLQEKNNLTK